MYGKILLKRKLSASYYAIMFTKTQRFEKIPEI